MYCIQIVTSVPVNMPSKIYENFSWCFMVVLHRVMSVRALTKSQSGRVLRENPNSAQEGAWSSNFIHTYVVLFKSVQHQCAGMPKKCRIISRPLNVIKIIKNGANRILPIGAVSESGSPQQMRNGRVNMVTSVLKYNACMKRYVCRVKNWDSDIITPIVYCFSTFSRYILLCSVCVSSCTVAIAAHDDTSKTIVMHVGSVPLNVVGATEKGIRVDLACMQRAYQSVLSVSRQSLAIRVVRLLLKFFTRDR